MSRHCFLPVRSRFVCTRGPSVVGADESPKVVLSLSLTHCLLFCVSDSRAVTSETSSLRCHHHTEFSSLYPRDAPFSLSSYSFLLCIPDKSDYERPRHVEAQETKPPPPPSSSLSTASSYRCHRFNCLFSRHETGSRARVSFIAVPRPVALSIDFIVALATLIKATRRGQRRVHRQHSPLRLCITAAS